jgi:L-ascorbate metabolism protein UlaG (beta-lactamase superfamily)
MKIQFFGNNTFGAFGKNARVVFDPADNFSGKNIDFTTNSNGQLPKNIEAKKLLNMPGEYEISNVLVKSIAQKVGKNILFKVTMDDLSIVHCGEMVEMPVKSLLEELGEDIDVLIISISDKFPAKKVKEFLETIEPRVAFIGGDFSKISELNRMIQINMVEENPISISRSTLSEDKSEYYVLAV